ncbi:unnamed protein product [Meloidogyne enterolobii]|uniref:Uncharacterized protein n=1 Tax=Meloidogyne enterolobii TaxID=390850 RepID=A0ACB0XTH4_MELEN
MSAIALRQQQSVRRLLTTTEEEDEEEEDEDDDDEEEETSSNSMPLNNTTTNACGDGRRREIQGDTSKGGLLFNMTVGSRYSDFCKAYKAYLFPKAMQ